jgi:hypothetical protein
VVTTDPFACGRNYFSRHSAPEQEEERARILADAKALHHLAEDFAHPERPVVTTDPFACGRNYFSRFSAPGQEGPEDVAERARVLEETQQVEESEERAAILEDLEALNYFLLQILLNLHIVYADCTSVSVT